MTYSARRKVQLRNAALAREVKRRKREASGEAGETVETVGGTEKPALALRNYVRISQASAERGSQVRTSRPKPLDFPTPQPFRIIIDPLSPGFYDSQLVVVSRAGRASTAPSRVSQTVAES